MLRSRHFWAAPAKWGRLRLQTKKIESFFCLYKVKRLNAYKKRLFFACLKDLAGVEAALAKRLRLSAPTEKLAPAPLHLKVSECQRFF